MSVLPYPTWNISQLNGLSLGPPASKLKMMGHEPLVIDSNLQSVPVQELWQAERERLRKLESLLLLERWLHF